MSLCVVRQGYEQTFTFSIHIFRLTDLDTWFVVNSSSFLVSYIDPLVSYRIWMKRNLTSCEEVTHSRCPVMVSVISLRPVERTGQIAAEILRSDREVI